jgi:hypothetical protein
LDGSTRIRVRIAAARLGGGTDRVLIALEGRQGSEDDEVEVGKG